MEGVGRNNFGNLNSQSVKDSSQVNLQNVRKIFVSVTKLSLLITNFIILQQELWDKLSE